MPRKKKVELELSKEAKDDIEFLRMYEPFLPLPMFKLRTTALVGYRYFRYEMVEATEEDWDRIYHKYYIKDVL